jgi:hypothetical protein
MNDKRCPRCGFEWTTELAESVEIHRKPDWWPPALEFPRRALTARKQICTRCNLERETWE